MQRFPFAWQIKVFMGNTRHDRGWSVGFLTVLYTLNHLDDDLRFHIDAHTGHKTKKRVEVFELSF